MLERFFIGFDQLRARFQVRGRVPVYNTSTVFTVTHVPHRFTRPRENRGIYSPRWRNIIDANTGEGVEIRALWIVFVIGGFHVPKNPCTCPMGLPKNLGDSRVYWRSPVITINAVRDFVVLIMFLI